LGDCLRIEFDEGEVLQVWGPDRCSISDQAFVIEQAHRVRWEWFYYGRPKTPENLYFQDFARDGDRIAVSTNADWFVDQQRAETAVAAVEIL
jgi:hypothetical protein